VLRIFILAFILLFSSNVYADELIPGSYTLEYGGIYKIIARESNRFLESQWRDQELARFTEGESDFLEFSRRQRQISEYLNDWRHGPPWWTRRWWHSFEEKNGGAKPNQSIVVRRGNTYKIIDTPLFSLNNSFELKWKTFEAAIDFQKKQPITIGIGSVKSPRVGWKLGFSPIVDLSSRRALIQPTRAINRLGITLGAIYYTNGMEILSVNVQTWYSFARNRTFVEIQLTLLRW